VFNTYCVVFLFCLFFFFLSTLVALSLHCPFFIAPSVFSNVYLEEVFISIVLLSFEVFKQKYCEYF